MMRGGQWIWWMAGVCGSAIAIAPAQARAETVCGTIEAFNAEMAATGSYATDVTLTYDIVGVNPPDFHMSKGALGQFRNTLCAAGQDATLKVYGTDDPFNDAHPPGTLKFEYGNQCCGGADCPERWVDPNASAVIFSDGTETCSVTLWLNPAEIGYRFVCNVGTFDGLGENPDANVVDVVALLEHVKPDGGTTWELPNATVSNVELCWDAVPGSMDVLTVPVLQDVTTGPVYPDTVFPDVGDLAVEAGDNMAYLMFMVPQIPGKVTSVRLLMHTRTESSSEGDGGEVHVVADSTWSEDTMTWNSRPMVDPASLGRIGPAAADTPVALDLGPVITKAGTYSFAIVSPPSDGNGTHFFSKEGSASFAASLTINYDVVDADGDGTPDGPDCNDADPAIKPGAQEICNGVDDDCDDTIDEGCDGGETEAGSDDDGATSSPDTGSDDAGGLPGVGFPRGDEGGCACTVSPRRRGLAWLALTLAFLTARRRRLRARP